MRADEFRGLTVHGHSPLGLCSIPFGDADVPVTVVVGRNGAGKSQLLSAIAGDVAPTSPDAALIMHTNAPPTNVIADLLHIRSSQRGMTRARREVNESEVFEALHSVAHDKITNGFEHGVGLDFPLPENIAQQRDRLVRSMIEAQRFACIRTGGEWQLWMCTHKDDLDAADSEAFLRTALLRMDPVDSEDVGARVLSYALWFDAMEWRTSAMWWQELFAHDWAAAPFVYLGVLSEPPVFARLGNDAREDLDSMALEACLLETGTHMTPGRVAMGELHVRHALTTGDDGGLDDDEAGGSPSLLDAADAISSTANEVFRALLDDPPLLEFGPSLSTTWADNKVFQWVIHDPSGAVPVAMASDGTRRWAMAAIQVALRDLRGFGSDLLGLQSPPDVLLIDEPERAIHRGAEARLGEGLNEIARRLHCRVIAATHSPALLRRASANVMQIRRDRLGLARLAEVTETAALASVGVTHEDLLFLVRLWVLVEGHHDELVLHAALGKELDRYGARVLPVGGASNLSSAAFNTRLILNETSANVLFVTDNVGPSEINAIRTQAIDHCTNGDHDRAIRMIEEALSDGVERRAIREVLLSAIAADRLEAAYVHPLEAPDILDYLNPDLISGLEDQRWGELREQHREWLQGPASKKQGQKRNFKAWLNLIYGVEFTDAQILEAIDEATLSHPDIQGLLDRVRVITRG